MDGGNEWRDGENLSFPFDPWANRGEMNVGVGYSEAKLRLLFLGCRVEPVVKGEKQKELAKSTPERAPYHGDHVLLESAPMVNHGPQ